VVGAASDKCQQEKRKTINGDDLLWAMSTLGFDKYVEPLKLYLSKYREVSPAPSSLRCGHHGRPVRVFVPLLRERNLFPYLP
jgi:hypothetical protein